MANQLGTHIASFIYGQIILNRINSCQRLYVCVRDGNSRVSNEMENKENNITHEWMKIEMKMKT